jgi:hypothetical protein
MRGGRGADRITPGTGRTPFWPGAATTPCPARGDTAPDRISRGSGFDIVVANARDKVGAGCERVRLRSGHQSTS